MAPRKSEPLRIFKHQTLIDKFNDFCITLKVNLCEFDCDTNEKREAITKLKLARPSPTVEELDELMMEIISALKEQSEDMIKY
jgi:hypothetical protein